MRRWRPTETPDHFKFIKDFTNVPLGNPLQHPPSSTRATVWRRIAIICPHIFCPDYAPPVDVQSRKNDRGLRCPFCGHSDKVVLNGFTPGIRAVVTFGETTGCISRSYKCTKCDCCRKKRDDDDDDDNDNDQGDAQDEPTLKPESRCKCARCKPDSKKSPCECAHCVRGEGGKYFTILHKDVLSQMDPAFRESIPFVVRHKTLVDTTIVDMTARLRVGGCGFGLFAKALKAAQDLNFLRRWKIYLCQVPSASHIAWPRPALKYAIQTGCPQRRKTRDFLAILELLRSRWVCWQVRRAGFVTAALCG